MTSLRAVPRRVSLRGVPVMVHSGAVTAVLVVALSLPGSGSSGVPVTVAVLLTVPVAVTFTFTTRVKVAVPEAIVGAVADTVPVPETGGVVVVQPGRARRRTRTSSRPAPHR